MEQAKKMVEHRSERVEAGIKLLQSIEHAGEENHNLISQGWYLYNTKQGIEIWKNASMASVHAVMGRGVVSGSHHEFGKIVTGIGDAEAYDPLLKSESHPFSGDISNDPSLGPREARQLAQLDEHNEIIYLRYRVGPFISDREFVYHESRRRHPETGALYIHAESIDHECPLGSGAVRGRLMHSGWVVRPKVLPDGQQGTEAIFLVQVDPAGYIPHWLVNMLAGEEPLIINRVGELARQRSEAQKQQTPADTPSSSPLSEHRE